MITMQFDERTTSQINRFLNASTQWEVFMGLSLAEDIGKLAEERIKPYLLGVRNDPAATGDTQKSLQTHVTAFGSGFEITFEADVAALWLDQGNGDGPIYSKSGRPMPIDLRHYGVAGVKYWANPVQPMGSRTPGVPMHYSDEVAEWLANEGAVQSMTEHLTEFLDWVVMP
jgi:hypothetical protein